MKPLTHVLEPIDRVSTREELQQVLSLLLELDESRGVEDSLISAADALASDADQMPPVSDVSTLPGLGLGKRERIN